MRHRYLYYFLLLTFTTLFRDFTPDNELKYISIANEALQNNNWFTFHNHGDIYADKPPLFLWLIMLSKLIRGGYHVWIIVLFSSLPALAIMAVMDRWIKNEESNSNTLAANLIIITTIMFLGAAFIIRMDMLMSLFIVLSLYKFYKIYKNKHSAYDKYLLVIYLFLAVFTKGLIGLLIPFTSIIAFLSIKKQISTFDHYFGWRQYMVFFALCMGWFILIYREGGMIYLDNMLLKQTIGRGFNSFHHKEPVWYYLPRMLWSFAPWSLLFIVLIWKSIQTKMINTDLEKFF